MQHSSFTFLSLFAPTRPRTHDGGGGDGDGHGGDGRDGGGDDGGTRC